MRLLIYYKSKRGNRTGNQSNIHRDSDKENYHGNDGVVQSLEMVSVNYRGTGKGGLANKGVSQMLTIHDFGSTASCTSLLGHIYLYVIPSHTASC